MLRGPSRRSPRRILELPAFFETDVADSEIEISAILREDPNLPLARGLLRSSVTVADFRSFSDDESLFPSLEMSLLVCEESNRLYEQPSPAVVHY